jgi:hypothetical protein
MDSGLMDEWERILRDRYSGATEEELQETLDEIVAKHPFKNPALSDHEWFDRFLAGWDRDTPYHIRDARPLYGRDGHISEKIPDVCVHLDTIRDACRGNDDAMQSLNLIETAIHRLRRQSAFWRRGSGR